LLEVSSGCVNTLRKAMLYRQDDAVHEIPNGRQMIYVPYSQTPSPVPSFFTCSMNLFFPIVDLKPSSGTGLDVSDEDEKNTYASCHP
jgi:hypothetical protein